MPFPPVPSCHSASTTQIIASYCIVIRDFLVIGGELGRKTERCSMFQLCDAATLLSGRCRPASLFITHMARLSSPQSLHNFEISCVSRTLFPTCSRA